MFIVINKLNLIIYFFENMATAFFNISFSISNSWFFFCNFSISSLLVVIPVDVVMVPYFFLHCVILVLVMPYYLAISLIVLSLLVSQRLTIIFLNSSSCFAHSFFIDTSSVSCDNYYITAFKFLWIYVEFLDTFFEKVYLGRI